MLTRKRTRSYFWMLLPLFHFRAHKSIKKWDRESADRRTHTVTETN